MLDAPRLGRFALVNVFIFPSYGLQFPSQPRRRDRSPDGKAGFIVVWRWTAGF